MTHHKTATRPGVLHRDVWTASAWWKSTLGCALSALLWPMGATAQVLSPMNPEAPVAQSPEALLQAVAGPEASSLRVLQRREVDLDHDGTTELLFVLEGVDAQAVIAFHRPDGWRAIVARSGGGDEVRVEGWDVPVVSGETVFVVLRTGVVDDNHAEGPETAVFTLGPGGLYTVLFEEERRSVQAMPGGLLITDAATRPRYRSLLWNPVEHRMTLSRWSRRAPQPAPVALAGSSSGSAAFSALTVGAGWRFGMGGMNSNGEEHTGNVEFRVVEVRPEGGGRRVRWQWIGIPPSETYWDAPAEVFIDAEGMHLGGLPQLVVPAGVGAPGRRSRARPPRGYSVTARGGAGCFAYSRQGTGWSLCFDSAGAPRTAHSGGTGAFIDLDQPVALSTAPAPASAIVGEARRKVESEGASDLLTSPVSRR